MGKKVARHVLQSEEEEKELKTESSAVNNDVNEEGDSTAGGSSEAPAPTVYVGLPLIMSPEPATLKKTSSKRDARSASKFPSKKGSKKTTKVGEGSKKAAEPENGPRISEPEPVRNGEEATAAASSSAAEGSVRPQRARTLPSRLRDLEEMDSPIKKTPKKKKKKRAGMKKNKKTPEVP